MIWIPIYQGLVLLMTALASIGNAFGSIDVGVGTLSAGDRVERGEPGAKAHGSGKLSYDALEPKGRRKSPPVQIVREDVNLRGNKRTRLQANANDIARNFSIAGWAIRRHLDYVARFTFQSQTGNRELDKQIEKLILIQSRPTNFDRGTRCSRERFFRLCEARRVLDGDTGILLLANGQVQGIESDLVRNPEKQDDRSSYEWVDGVEVDFAGAPRRYSVWGRKRGGSGYEWRRNVAAANMILYGFFDRFASEQIRGVSPIVSALNPLRDVYENIDYALIKAKLSQLFAIALMRGADADPMDKVLPGKNEESADGEAEVEEETEEQKPRSIDFSHGPTVLDLDVGEKAEVIESKTPSNELQQFSRLVVMIALKALDIPYSFFDEGHTNYSGSRGSWLHYERSTLTQRDDQIEMRRRWTIAQYQRMILDDLLVLPRGMTISDLDFEWVPLGMPWWKPSEEITGDLKAIAGGLDSVLRVTKARGTGDVHDNIDDLITVMKYAHEQGKLHLGEPLRLNFDPGPFASAVMTDDQPTAKN
jgi:capsid protein